MDAETLSKFLDTQEKLLIDRRYQQLYDVYSVCDDHLLALLKTLPQDQADVILDYIGVLGDIHSLALEIACQS